MCALFSAALFGVSPVIAKMIIGDMSPVLLAGLLYFGAGVSLLILNLRQSFLDIFNLGRAQKIKFFASTICGGIIAPLCLTFGISKGTAFEVSLLLNLETVATTLIAALIFKEHVGVRIWIGKILLILGAAILTFRAEENHLFSAASVFVLGACLFWGIDNNLTRDLEDLKPSVLAGTKGLIAGIFNIVLASILGFGQVHLNQVLISSVLGAFSYGASLVLFVLALRKLGASRTGAYFASGPFLGMAGAVLFLGEKPSVAQWSSAALMAIGIWTLLRERHEHEHTHESMEHSHRHIHDEHHQHEHDGTEGPEPHEHRHVHGVMTHTHRHLPDIHHRHSH